MNESGSESTLAMGGGAAGPGGDAARLIIVEGTRPGDHILLDREVTSIGRDPTNDWVLDDAMVSSFHARVLRTGAAHLIEDRDSTNGIAVNGVPIPHGDPGRLLKHGDVLQISNHLILYVSRPSTADSTDFSSIRIDRGMAEREAEALLREFPLLHRSTKT
jgi:pSer/pThr/pTyr-binding forkhead associated (FHA) protein